MSPWFFNMFMDGVVREVGVVVENKNNLAFVEHEKKIIHFFQCHMFSYDR